MKDGQVEQEDYEVDEMEEGGEVDLNGGGSTLIISESALSINGDDSRESCDQLSIDTGADTEAEPVRPSIRVAKGLIKENSSDSQQPSLGILAAHLSGAAGTKRKQSSPGVNTGNGIVGLPLKKQRPNAHENEMEILSLEKEIKALEWLARKKEQEWDQIIRLLKQKEEKLMKAQRAKVMIQVEADHLLTKYRPSQSQPSTVVVPSPHLQPVIVPQQQLLLLPTSQTVSASSSTTRHIQPKPSGASLMAQARTSVTAGGRNSSSKSPSPSKPSVTTSNGSNGEVETKFSSVLDRANKNLQRAAASPSVEKERDNGRKEEGKKNTPLCQGCGQKKSEFVCAGCSNRWYCSRECQVGGEEEEGDIFISNSYSLPGGGLGRTR